MVTVKRPRTPITDSRSRTWRRRWTRCAATWPRRVARRSGWRSGQSLDPAVRGDNAFAQCALDLAAHDLWGKLRGEPVYRLWGLNTDRSPLSDYTIGIDTIETMVAKMRSIPIGRSTRSSWGRRTIWPSCGNCGATRTAVFRVDANCAWTVGGNAPQCPRTARLERRVHRTTAAGRPVARRCGACSGNHAALPVIADESCQVESDVRGATVLSRHQHQALQMRRTDTGPADDRNGPRAGPAGHGRLHDRVDGRHLGHRPVAAAAGLCGHGRRVAAERGRGRRRAPGAGPLRVSGDARTWRAAW